MATSYPGGYDSLPRPSASDTMDDTAGGLDGPAVIDNISDAIEAIEAELGLNPANEAATVAAAIAGRWIKWTGTQAEYDALGTYDDNTLYVVVG